MLRPVTQSPVWTSWQENLQCWGPVGNTKPMFGHRFKHGCNVLPPLTCYRPQPAPGVTHSQFVVTTEGAFKSCQFFRNTRNNFIFCFSDGAQESQSLGSWRWTPVEVQEHHSNSIVWGHCLLFVCTQRAAGEYFSWHPSPLKEQSMDNNNRRDTD